ncbi:hypothetical protein [Pseudonocardia xishanensis]|uniref:Mce-associated membrane protein n=1 Tax=Pseudonocardia xishanensis TaxID=630995 RepID=A0ABP8RTF7_9PSEU
MKTDEQSATEPASPEPLAEAEAVEAAGPADTSGSEVETAGTDGGGGGEAVAPRPRPATVAAAVLAVLLVAAAVLLGILWNDGRQLDERRDRAVAEAQDMAVALVSVSSDSAEQDVRRIMDGAVGDFGKIFSENLDSYVDIVRKGGVETSGEVVSSGLERLDGPTARVLVALRAEVRNQQAPDGEQRTYRMAVEMTEQPDGEWLADKVEFVP